MADLVPNGLPPGYRVTGVGLAGTVTAVPPTERDVTRGGPLSESATVDAALRDARVDEVQLIQVDARVEPGTAPATRADGASGTLRVEVPDLGGTSGQIVLLMDRDGALSWHFPVARLGTDATRGGDALVFDIPFRAEEAAEEEIAERGVVRVVRKALKVLVYDLVDDVLGEVGEHFAGRWEARNRPARVRAFLPGSSTDAGFPSLTPDEWRALDGRTALLFVHGTFSTAHGGFAGLPEATLGELGRRYDATLAFDHPTVSVDPEANLKRFAELVPPDVRVTFDVVSHSRGGLVTRALAGELGAPLPGVAVRHAVLVATPNRGTPLADAAHMAGLLDRVTTGLNLLPPGPHSTVVEVLTAVITAVKVIGRGVLGGLDGLQSMHGSPDGFLSRLNAGPASAATYYGIASDFEPVGGFKSLVRGTVPDAVLDIVFGQDANDLVVPTLGVSDHNDDPSFPIAPHRLHAFDRTKSVWHCGYFNQPDTSRRLLEWLPGR